MDPHRRCRGWHRRTENVLTAYVVDHSLAAHDDIRIGSPLQKIDIEHVWQLGPRRQFIRRCARRCEPALRIPQQLFEGEPAYALQESTLDLPAIHQWRNGIADILEQILNRYRLPGRSHK